MSDESSQFSRLDQSYSDSNEEPMEQEPELQVTTEAPRLEQV